MASLRWAGEFRNVQRRWLSCSSGKKPKYRSFTRGPLSTAPLSFPSCFNKCFAPLRDLRQFSVSVRRLKSKNVSRSVSINFFFPIHWGTTTESTRQVSLLPQIDLNISAKAKYKELISENHWGLTRVALLCELETVSYAFDGILMQIYVALRSRCFLRCTRV